MHEEIEEIKKIQQSPKVIKNLYSKEEINEFLDLYKTLPTTVHNKKQNVIKKRWLQGYDKDLENLFCERLKLEIGDFRMDFEDLSRNLRFDGSQRSVGVVRTSAACHM